MGGAAADDERSSVAGAPPPADDPTSTSTSEDVDAPEDPDVDSDPPLAGVPPLGDRFRIRLALGIAAALLCLIAIPQALWSADLEAPQYRGDNALRVTAYGDRLVGDICELNDLNHYIGMRRLGEPDIPCGSAALGRGENTVGRIAPEMVLWLPSALLAAGAAILAALATRRLLRWAALAWMWGLPLGVLVMTQYHLYIFGHDLDRTAAFRPESFTPRVLGPSTIYQFSVDARPGLGLILVTLAAALVAFGPWLLTRAERWQNTRTSVLLGILAAAIAVTALAAPTTATATASSSEHDASPAAEALGAELAERLAIATDGDTVVIGPGHYRGNFVVTAGITIIGQGRPTLDGGGSGTVLTLTSTAAGAEVRGIRVIGSGPGPVNTPSGIRADADGVVIRDVEVSDSYMGVQFRTGRDVVLADSVIEGIADGGIDDELHATGDQADITGIDYRGEPVAAARMRGDGISALNTIGATIEGNRVIGARDGVYLSFAADTTVRDNEVFDSRYALHSMYSERLAMLDNYFDGNLAGAILMYAGPFELRGNTVLRSTSPATGIGLLIKDGAGARVIENVIIGNRVGLKIDNGGATSSSVGPAEIRANTIGLNQIGAEVMHGSQVSFTRNSFVENTVQVVTDGAMPYTHWSVDSVGNYWSNYRGYDNTGDGIGDVDFVQGGSVSNTLTRAPVIMSLASGPAFRLLQAIEDRWAPENPMVRDEFPLMAMESPVVDEERRTESAPIWFGISGGAAVGSSVLVLGRARRPRPVRHG